MTETAKNPQTGFETPRVPEQARPHNERREPLKETPARPLLDRSLTDDEIAQRLEQAFDVREMMGQEPDDLSEYILDQTLIALEIKPTTDESLDAVIDAKHANARMNWHHAKEELDKFEFGEMMMSLLDNVEERDGESNLFRAFDIIRQTHSGRYRTSVIHAHRTALFMLEDERKRANLED